MVTLKKYNLDAKEVGEVQIGDAFFDVDANRQMIKDYLVALHGNTRQWSANTKGRSEVNHSTKKPHPQKGTGRARQGRLSSPQYKGGGVVFGPKPKFDQGVRINRKERRLANRHILAEKITSGHVIVVEDAVFSGALEAPKTKSVANFLKLRELLGKRLLFVAGGVYCDVGEEGLSVRISIGTDQYDTFKRSVRNLNKSSFIQAPNVNGYELLANQRIVITESALSELVELLM